MNTPGFTAETSLAKMNDGYALASEFAAGEAAVTPQIFCRRDESGTTCYECWNEGGISGCITFRVPRFTAH